MKFSRHPLVSREASRTTKFHFCPHPWLFPGGQESTSGSDELIDSESFEKFRHTFCVCAPRFAIIYLKFPNSEAFPLIDANNLDLKRT